MKILVLGSTGMLGHVVSQYFFEKGCGVIKTTRKNDDPLYFDVEKNINQLEKIIESTKPDVVINCIGILNQKAEDNKTLAVIANSLLPHYIDQLSEKYSFKFIHISTDCVFSGNTGSYTEDSFQDATSFYGRSKALGEINNNRSVTLRTSIVGPDINENGIGLFNWFMKQTGEVQGFTNVIWTGVTTIELAKQIEFAIKNDLKGLYNVVNGNVIDKYSLLQLFKEKFNKEIEIIPNGEQVSKKTLLPSQKCHFDIPSYEQMIEEMKNWIIEHKELYGEKYIRKEEMYL